MQETDRIRLATLRMRQFLNRSWVRLRGRTRTHSALVDAKRQLLRLTLQQNLLSDRDVDVYSCPVCCEMVPTNLSTRVVTNESMFEVGPLNRYRCPQCDLVFGPISMLRLGPTALMQAYELLYSVYAEGRTTDVQRFVLMQLEPQPHQRILNYACGDWEEGLLQLLIQEHDAYGYEPALRSRHPRIARSLGHLSTQFDLIFSHNFIEHLQDPNAQLQTWRKLLAPRGKMAHSTACFEWLYHESPFHLCYFFGRSLDVLAARNGFRISERRAFHRGEESRFHEVAIFELA